MMHSFPLRLVEPIRCSRVGDDLSSPSKRLGEFALHTGNISSAYASRPTLHVLKDVSLFLPANEVTFIVGPPAVAINHRTTIIEHVRTSRCDMRGHVLVSVNKELLYLMKSSSRT